MPTKPKSEKPSWDKLTLRAVEQWGQVFAEPESAGSDRFTFVFPDGSYLGMNAVPFHPTYGVGLHGEGIVEEWRNEHEKHRVKTQRTWRKLPPDVRRCIHQEIERLRGAVIKTACAIANDYGDGDGADMSVDEDTRAVELPTHDPGNDADRGATYAWVKTWIRVPLY